MKEINPESYIADVKLSNGVDALGEGDLFDVEYWELEQRKLRSAGNKSSGSGFTPRTSMMAGLIALVYKTKMGIAMRATSQNPQVAGLMGIDINRVIAATFVIGAALGAVVHLTVELDLGGQAAVRRLHRVRVGAGVARGYCADPLRAAASFVTVAGRRWYRTGDLVTEDANGGDSRVGSDHHAYAGGGLL